MRRFLLLTLATGCRIGFDASDRPPVTTVVPVAGAPDFIAGAGVTQADGSTVIAGSVETGSGLDWAITRLDPSGAVDRSFGTDGTTVIDLGSDEDLVHGMVVDATGVVTIVGETRARGDYDTAIVRLTARGKLDTGFGQGGLVIAPLSNAHNFDDRAYAVALDAQGRALVAGYRNTDYPGWEDTYLARVLSDGTFDPTFGTAGVVTSAARRSNGSSLNDFPRWMTIDSASRILVGLTCSYDACLFRFTPDGVLDSSFGDAGLALIDAGKYEDADGFALDRDDGVYIAGTTYDDATPHTAFVTRVTTEGTLDTAFGTAGVVTLAPHTRGRAVAAASDAIYLGGISAERRRDSIMLVRLDRGGAVDTTFGGAPLVDSGGTDVRELRIDAAGEPELFVRAGNRIALVRGTQVSLPPEPITLPFTVTSGAADLALGPGATVDGSAHSRAAPLRAGTLSISGDVGTTGAPALFIAATRVELSAGAVLHADGASGGMPVTGPGAGGAGGSGGGCGSFSYSGFAGFGGRFGRSGQSISGPAGAGFAAMYATDFFYGLGGDGGAGRGCCPPRVPGGQAGNGGGGGGGGSWTNMNTCGGGGGGGLVAIVTDTLTGAGATIAARGGAGCAINGAGSGGGGGGVVWIAARSYDGGLTVDVRGGLAPYQEPGMSGSARIFQIRADGTLVERSFTESW